MDEVAVAVLAKYPRALLALRAALREGRLGVMLGAGVSRAFHFNGSSPPTWQELVSAIESELGFDGSESAYSKLPLTQQVELLYRVFLHQKGVAQDDPVGVQAVRGMWRDSIRRHLYAGSPPAGHLARSHPYIGPLLDLVLQSPLTITYNFDSFLEECLLSRPRAATGGPTLSYQRPFESISDVSIPQRRTRSVVYHINGYLPRSPLETPSEHLVFSEGEFSGQLMMAMAGRYATIAHHLVNNVYLLIGLSLSDANLRHLLRTNAMGTPGRVHFAVRHIRDAPTGWESLTETQRGVAEVGFDLHNLYTLYLTTDEVAALSRLVAMDAGQFSELATSAGVPTKLVYYVSGVPGIGKTTLLNHMGGLHALDEWVEEPHELLLRPHPELSDGERQSLDSWIASQFKLKNEVLRNFDEGIFVVERGPLDPLAFEDHERVMNKAEWYRSSLDTSRHPLQNGQLVLLHGDTEVVAQRIAGRQAGGQPAEYLAGLQKQMASLYAPAKGILEWRSTEWSISQLVKKFASLVYVEDYVDANLQDRLANLASTGLVKA